MINTEITTTTYAAQVSKTNNINNLLLTQLNVWKRNINNTDEFTPAFSAQGKQSVKKILKYPLLLPQLMVSNA